MKLIALSSLAVTIILTLSVAGYRALDGRATATGAAAALGDANCDTAVNSIDASLVLQVDAGLLDTVSCPQAADASGDGLINSLDAVLILQHSAGLALLGSDISGRWQYDGEADYFLFEKERSLAGGAVIYTYEEICARDGRVKGRGTATARGNRVTMEGSDDFRYVSPDLAHYVAELDLSPDRTRMSGPRQRPDLPGYPKVDIALVKGTHDWEETVCHLFSTLIAN